jgi:hypothetical protein
MNFRMTKHLEASCVDSAHVVFSLIGEEAIQKSCNYTRKKCFEAKFSTQCAPFN